MNLEVSRPLAVSVFRRQVLSSLSTPPYLSMSFSALYIYGDPPVFPSCLSISPVMFRYEADYCYVYSPGVCLGCYFLMKYRENTATRYRTYFSKNKTPKPIAIIVIDQLFRPFCFPVGYGSYRVSNVPVGILIRPPYVSILTGTHTVFLFLEV